MNVSKAYESMNRVFFYLIIDVLVLNLSDNNYYKTK